MPLSLSARGVRFISYTSIYRILHFSQDFWISGCLIASENPLGHRRAAGENNFPEFPGSQTKEKTRRLVLVFVDIQFWNDVCASETSLKLNVLAKGESDLSEILSFKFVVKIISL